MIADERRQRILEEVRLTGVARVTALALALGVSEMTVRRDIEWLASAGELRRVHGGATARTGSASGTAAGADTELDAIAGVAASMVFPGMSVAISGGECAPYLARRLVEIPNLTVLTNSMEVATILRQAASSISVLVTGGAPSADGTLLGSLTVRAIHTLNTDLAFVWTTGIDVDRGITVDSMLESDAATAILHSTKRSVALATHPAIGEIRLAHVCPLDDVDAVIVSGPLAPATEQHLRSRAGTLLVARVADRGR